MFDILYSFFMYLIHPFRTHDELSGKEVEESLGIVKISLYEALGTSWVFVVINGLFRIILINFVIIMFYKFTNAEDGLIMKLIGSGNITSFYFLVLSTVLDIIFFPLLTLIVVHFWEFIVKLYASLLGIKGDVEQKARDVLTVSLSSNILMVIPFFGDLAQKLVSIFLIFVGLKKQFGMGSGIILCVLFTPFAMLLGFSSVLMLLFMASIM